MLLGGGNVKKIKIDRSTAFVIGLALLVLSMLLWTKLSATAGTKIKSECEHRWNVEVASVQVRFYPDIVAASNARDQAVTVQIERSSGDAWVPLISFDLAQAGLQVTDDVLSDAQTVRLHQKPLEEGDQLRVTIKPFWGKGRHLVENLARRAKREEPQRAEPIGQEVIVLDE
jgi:hypothetical protein